MSKAPKTCGSLPPSQLLPKERGGLMCAVSASGHSHHLGAEQDVTPVWACFAQVRRWMNI